MRPDSLFQHSSASSESVHLSSVAVMQGDFCAEESWNEKLDPGLFYMQFLFARKLVLHDQHICIKDNKTSSETRQSLYWSELGLLFGTDNALNSTTKIRGFQSNHTGRLRA